MSSEGGRATDALAALLRIAIGWHFLYEGIVKLLDPEWTSAGYLLNSRWLFAGVFHWLAAHQSALRIVDFLNEWGLVLIGLGLLLGLFPRLTAGLGAGLLALYYVAAPALPGFLEGLPTEGNYLIVSKNLIELLALVWLATNTGHTKYGLAVLPRSLWGRVQRRSEGGDKKASPSDAFGLSRREVMKSLTPVPFAAAFGVAFGYAHGIRSLEERRLLERVGGQLDAVTTATMKTRRLATIRDLKAPVPKGRIGSFEISRLICGGNLISGFAHARDLIYVSTLLREYFTDEKVIETLQICEACGINTAILRNDRNTLRILDKYWRRGGKIQWLAQVYPREDDLFTNPRIAIDNGAIGAFVQGNIADRWVRSGKIDLLANVIQFIRDRNVLCGTAGHSLRTAVVFEREGIPVDFYMKTLHPIDYWSYQTEEKYVEVVDNRHDNYWCVDPDEVIEFMRRVDKPWIAYKVLAAGAVRPEAGFRFAFEGGADFLCVGMFDFQVVEDANVVVGILSEGLQRERAWAG